MALKIRVVIQIVESGTGKPVQQPELNGPWHALARRFTYEERDKLQKMLSQCDAPLANGVQKLLELCQAAGHPVDPQPEGWDEP